MRGPAEPPSPHQIPHPTPGSPASWPNLESGARHALTPVVVVMHLPQFPHLMPASPSLHLSYDPLALAQLMELLSIPETGQDHSLRVLPPLL